MFQDKNYKRWFVQGTISILIFGTGLCLFGEATVFKLSKPPTWQWVAYGTGTLIVVMTGIILMVDSLKYKIYYELEERKREESSTSKVVN